MRTVEKVIYTIIKRKKWISAILLILMLTVIFSQVVLRYVFNSPTTWSEEITLLWLVWFCYITMSIEVRQDGHVALELFYNKVSKKTQIVFDGIRHVSVLVFSLLMIYYGWLQFKMNLFIQMPTTRIPMGIMYLSLFVGGVFIAIYSLLEFLYTINPYLKNQKAN